MCSCLIEPVPAGSKTAPPLAKAKAISGGGSASGITYLRRGKKCDDVRETTLQTPRSVKKEGGEVLQMPEQSFFPLQPVEKTASCLCIGLVLPPGLPSCPSYSC